MLVAVGAVLTIGAIVVAFLIKPPLLGWVGFAVVAAIMLGMAALTPLAFERTRVTPQLPAEPRERGTHARDRRPTLQRDGSVRSDRGPGVAASALFTWSSRSASRRCTS